MNEIHGCNQLLDLAEDILVQQTEERHGMAALTLSHQLAEWFSALLQFAHLAQKSGSRGEPIYAWTRSEYLAGLYKLIWQKRENNAAGRLFREDSQCMT